MTSYFEQWVANAIADIVATQSLYWRGLEGERPLTLVTTTANFRVVGCQAYFDSREQAQARFSGLFANQFTVFH